MASAQAIESIERVRHHAVGVPTQTELAKGGSEAPFHGRSRLDACAQQVFGDQAFRACTLNP